MNGTRVIVDLDRIRTNVGGIARQCAVDVIGVVKADSYGLGSSPVVEAIDDLVAEFCVFELLEAAAIRAVTKKTILSLGPSENIDVEKFIALGVRPAVWTVEQAGRLRKARPILCIDTGMQRFACPPEDVDTVIAAGGIDEAFTHATRVEHVKMLKSIAEGRKLRLHAAASSLLGEPVARLDAVRPGIAMYRGAARIVTPLVEVRSARGPVGYTGFEADRFGVIVCGYSNGLRKGSCLIGGKKQPILEIGMQSAYVRVGPDDRAGDEVVLLGDGLSEAEIAREWNCSEQQVLASLARAGVRSHLRRGIVAGG
jgi:alanine racemase